MSDTKLREAERQWRETGSAEDEAVYLRERMRAGGLAKQRVELAAWAGDPAARIVVGAREPWSVVPFQKFGQEECIAIAWATLATFVDSSNPEPLAESIFKAVGERLAGIPASLAHLERLVKRHEREVSRPTGEAIPLCNPFSNHPEIVTDPDAIARSVALWAARAAIDPRRFAFHARRAVETSSLLQRERPTNLARLIEWALRSPDSSSDLSRGAGPISGAE